MSKQSRGKRRGSYKKYEGEQREVAVGDVRQLGLLKAVAKHGIPSSTLGNWVRRPKSRITSARPPGWKRKPAKRYTPSQRGQILEDAAKDGPTTASEKHGCSRFAIYDWSKKVALAAQGEGASPTSGPAPTEIEAQRDQEILGEWKKHPGLGPSQIRNQPRAKCVKVSVNTVRRVMEEAGYRPPKVRRQPHDQRYEAVRPNHIWHLDFVHRHIHRATTFTLILIDDHSRYVVGHGVDEVERADMVIETFEEAVRRHGKPEMVMHDKGGAFWSWRGISRFTALLTELGVDQIVAEHKEWNGKVEVFNANLHKELFDVQRFVDVGEMRRRLATHLHFSNHARTHHALGGLLVPADRYFGRAEEVLARIESGEPRDASDTLELRDRCLELFKVASRNGVPKDLADGTEGRPRPQLCRRRRRPRRSRAKSCASCWTTRAASTAGPISGTTPTPSAGSSSTCERSTQSSASKSWRTPSRYPPFCEHVAEHLRVPYRRTAIAAILEAHGVRLRKRRDGRSPTRRRCAMPSTPSSPARSGSPTARPSPSPSSARASPSTSSST